MKTQRLFLTLAALAALVSSGQPAGAQRRNAVVSRTADAAQATDTFTPKDHVIYCLAEVSKRFPNGKYKFNWGRYEPPQTTPATIFQDEVEYKGGDYVVSKFSSPADLPAGDYSVNVWGPGGHLRALFTVK